MNETFDKIGFTNPDGTTREMTEADFERHKVFDCGCKISFAKGWPMKRFTACKPECTVYALWQERRLSDDGEIMCRECCRTDGHDDWCSHKTQQ